METQYFKWYSPALQQDMECKVYGHAGRPVLFIPCQDGKFFDFENFKMTDTWAPWIESGQVMIYSIDTIDRETWSDTWGNADWRIYRYEQWINYITQEVVPFIQNMTIERNGMNTDTGIMTFGCSLGATHAANLYYRFPPQATGASKLRCPEVAPLCGEEHRGAHSPNSNPVPCWLAGGDLLSCLPYWGVVRTQ